MSKIIIKKPYKSGQALTDAQMQQIVGSLNSFFGSNKISQNSIQPRSLSTAVAAAYGDGVTMSANTPISIIGADETHLADSALEGRHFGEKSLDLFSVKANFSHVQRISGTQPFVDYNPHYTTVIYCQGYISLTRQTIPNTSKEVAPYSLSVYITAENSATAPCLQHAGSAGTGAAGAGTAQNQSAVAFTASLTFATFVIPADPSAEVEYEFNNSTGAWEVSSGLRRVYLWRRFQSTATAPTQGTALNDSTCPKIVISL